MSVALKRLGILKSLSMGMNKGAPAGGKGHGTLATSLLATLKGRRTRVGLTDPTLSQMRSSMIWQLCRELSGTLADITEA